MSYISKEEFSINLNKRVNNNLDEIEKIELIESIEYPGFFHVPIYKDLVVSKDFQVKSISTGKFLTLTSHTQHNNYRIIKIRHDIKIGKNNYITKGYILSRVIASVFIGRPLRHLDKDLHCLEVNHIDGDSTNYRLNNLEWVTKIENIEHKRLHIFNEKEISVLAKNISTKEILEFKSITLCGEYFSIPKTTLHNHLISPNVRRGYKDNYIFKINDNSEWYEFDINNSYEICSGSNTHHLKKVLALHLPTNKIKEFISVKECAEYFSIKRNTLTCYLNYSKHKKGHKNYWIFKYENDGKVWVIHPLSELYEIGAEPYKR